MGTRVLIQGKKLSDIRKERYMTQEEFAQELEMSPANVRRLEQSPITGVHYKNFRRLAQLLKLGPSELEERIGVDENNPDEIAEIAASFNSKTSLALKDLPSGMRPDSRQNVSQMAHYHGVSAATVEDRPPTQRDNLPVPVGMKRPFAVTVDGDCMAPVYLDGDMVIFSIEKAEREGIIDGKNYFVQLFDGNNTFKRVFLDPENRDVLILRCWNEKYPERVIERAAVKVLARAIYKLTPDE